MMKRFGSLFLALILALALVPALAEEQAAIVAEIQK